MVLVLTNGREVLSTVQLPSLSEEEIRKTVLLAESKGLHVYHLAVDDYLGPADLENWVIGVWEDRSKK